jgi:hypothetical protein
MTKAHGTKTVPWLPLDAKDPLLSPIKIKKSPRREKTLAVATTTT